MASDQGITSRHDHSVTDRTPVHIGLPFAPRAPLRAALAELIFRAGFRNLPVRVILPDGQRWGGGGADTPVMYLARPAEFFRRIGTDANVGLGEAYQAGTGAAPTSSTCSPCSPTGSPPRFRPGHRPCAYSYSADAATRTPTRSPSPDATRPPTTTCSTRP